MQAELQQQQPQVTNLPTTADPPMIPAYDPIAAAAATAAYYQIYQQFYTQQQQFHGMEQQVESLHDENVDQNEEEIIVDGIPLPTGKRPHIMPAPLPPHIQSRIMQVQILKQQDEEEEQLRIHQHKQAPVSVPASTLEAMRRVREQLEQEQKSSAEAQLIVTSSSPPPQLPVAAAATVKPQASTRISQAPKMIPKSVMMRKTQASSAKQEPQKPKPELLEPMRPKLGQQDNFEPARIATTMEQQTSFGPMKPSVVPSFGPSKPLPGQFGPTRPAPLQHSFGPQRPPFMEAREIDQPQTLAPATVGSQKQLNAPSVSESPIEPEVKQEVSIVDDKKELRTIGVKRALVGLVQDYSDDEEDISEQSGNEHPPRKQQKVVEQSTQQPMGSLDLSQLLHKSTTSPAQQESVLFRATVPKSILSLPKPAANK